MDPRNANHTFVVCAYKESPYLRECIQSLLNQTVPSVIRITTSTPGEYIQKAAEEFGLELIVNTESRGIAADWNFAMEQCDTPYCTLAHQDDVYDPAYTETILQRMTDDTLIAFSEYYELRGEERTAATINLKIKRILLRGLKNSKHAGSRSRKWRALSLGNAICCPAVTYNMKNIPHGLFQEGMRSNIDWQAWEVLSRMEWKFQYVASPLMAHRIHEGSETTQTIKARQRTGEDFEMFRKFWPEPAARLLTCVYASSEKTNSET